MKRNSSELKQFLKDNSDRHEIFHQGYRRGLRTGYTIALKRASELLRIMREVQEDIDEK